MIKRIFRVTLVAAAITLGSPVAAPFVGPTPAAAITYAEADKACTEFASSISGSIGDQAEIYVACMDGM